MRAVSRSLGLSSFVVLLGLSACSDEVGLGQLQPKLESDLVVDFGLVPVGLDKKLSLVLRNTGDGLLKANRVVPGAEFATGRYVFKVPSDGFELSAKKELSLEVRFMPLAVSGETPFESSFTVETTATDGSGGAISRTITVRGRGVAAAVEIVPSPLDFGTILAGSTKTLTLRVTNLLADELRLTSATDGAGHVAVRQVSGDGRFVVTAPVTRGGSLIANDGTLAGGASIELPVRYEPNPIPTMTADEARWTISTCPDPLCDVTVRLIGRSTDNAIACMPAAIDFGAVNPGATLRRPVTCTNVASDTVTIGPWALEAGGSSTFGIAPFAGSSTLAPGASYTVDVSFTPTEAMLQTGPVMGRAVFSALGSTGQALMPIRVVLSGRAGGPTIVVTPAELHFGGMAIGTSRTRNFIVSNDGYEDLLIADILEGPARTGDFSANPSTALVIPSGTATVVAATFAPSTAGAIASSLVIRSNDAVNPELSLPADGAGVALPPCQYNITPATIQFGLVYVGETATAAATLTNVGTDACLINDVELIGRMSPTSFTLPRGPQTGIMLAAGAALTLDVSYTPRTAGPEQADVAMFISDPAMPNITIPVSGVGGAITEIACPPNQTVAAGNPVVLSAMGMVIGRTVTGYQWSIVSAPMGGIGTPNQWTPDPPDTATVSFLPYIVGVYTLQATVFDDQGGSAVCNTVVTAEGQGLRVTMTWDGTGDVDLHLHRPQAITPWFGATNGDDCFYANRTPVWDPMSLPSVGSNPELDFDNTSSLGPENTTVDLPILNVDYTIGVHNYSNAAGRVVTIQVYCGNGILPVQTFTSRPLAAGGAGQCTGNEFWTVAAVSFQNLGACTITPIDTYRLSSAACMAF
jgi:hypothetical protein